MNNNNDNNDNNNNKNNAISWGEGSSLALVGKSSRNSASIRILLWRHLKPNPQLL